MPSAIETHRSASTELYNFQAFLYQKAPTQWLCYCYTFLNFLLEAGHMPWLWSKLTLLQGSWYHFQARIWTVKVMSEKSLQISAPPLCNNFLTSQFSIYSSTRLCLLHLVESLCPGGISAPFLKTVLSFLSGQGQKDSQYFMAIAVSPEVPLAWCLCYPWVFREAD